MARRPARQGATRQGRETAGEGALSLERIVHAAIRILDTDGLSGLSMRRLAQVLDAGAMSLYWHVENKETVLDLALDAVLRVEAVEESEASWRAAVQADLRSWRSSMLRHPWSAGLLARRPLGPSTLHRLERLASLLAAGGIAPDRLNAAVWALWNMTIGASVTRASFIAGLGEGAGGSSAAPEMHPTIAASNLLGEADWDHVFDAGADRLLAGFLQP